MFGYYRYQIVVECVLLVAAIVGGLYFILSHCCVGNL